MIVVVAVLVVFAAAVVGLAAAIRVLGFRAVISGMGQQLAAIRAFDVLGCGVRLLGIRAGTEPSTSVATFWVTAFYVPIVPLTRTVLQFVDPHLHEARWLVVRRTPLSGCEVARTYLFGWLIFPVLVVWPFGAGVLIDSLGAWLPLPELARLACTFIAGALVLAGVPWFAITVYRLRSWDIRRKAGEGS